MHISAKVDYAVRALLGLADAGGGAVPAELLAITQELPRQFLQNILNQLRRAGLVTSQRGSKGGYRLARRADEVLLADVMRAVEGPLAEVRGDRPEAVFYTGSAEHLQDVWVAVRASLRLVLEQVTPTSSRSTFPPRSGRSSPTPTRGFRIERVLEREVIFRRKCLLASLAAAVLLSGCGGKSMDEGRSSALHDAPVSSPGGLAPAATPGPTGSAIPNPSAVEAGLAGQGIPVGTAPNVAPRLQALQILGIPVFALPPEVVAALRDDGGGIGAETGDGTQAGARTGTSTETGPAGPGETGIGIGAAVGAGVGTISTGVGAGPGAGTGTSTEGQSGGSQDTGAQHPDGGDGTTPPPLPTSTDFCAPAHDLSNALNAVGAARTPGPLESAVTWARSAFLTAQATAPPSLDAEVDTLANAFAPLFDDMEAAGYELSRVGLGSFAALSSSEARAANVRLNEYVISVC